MPSESSSNRWVFREGRRVDSGSTVRSDLAASLAALRPTNEAILSALIQAGEFEAALSDRGAPDAELAAQVTDALAAGLLEPAAARHLDQLTAIVDKIEVPDRIALSVPEGFAYYALHPAAYAERVMEMRLRAPQAAVIGIRSIGTTLAAIVAAALARNGVPADRITVRPEGPPSH